MNSPCNRRTAHYIILPFLVFGVLVDVAWAQTSCFTGVLASVTFNSLNGSPIVNAGNLTFAPGSTAACGISSPNGIIAAGTGGAHVNFNFTNQGTGVVLQNLGVINISDGATMQWTSFSGTVVVQDNGAINLGQGGTGAKLTLFDSATFDLTGTGTLTMSAGGNDSIVGGTLTEGLINDVSHTIQGSGSISGVALTNNGNLYVTGQSGMAITPSLGHTLVNWGTIDVTGANGLLETFTTYNPTQAALQNNGTFVDSSITAITGGGYVNGVLGGTTLTNNARMGVPSFQNYGLLTIDLGAVLLTKSWLDLGAAGVLGDGGRYSVNGGQFDYVGGDILNLANVSISLGSGGSTTLSHDSIGSVPLFSHDGGITSALNNLNNIGSAASLQLTGVTQNLLGSLSNSGTLSLLGNSAMTVNVGGNGTLTNVSGAQLTVDASTLNIGAPSFDGHLLNSGSVSVSGTGVLSVEAGAGGGTVVNSGTIGLTGGSLIINSGGAGTLTTLSGAGGITLTNGAIAGASGWEILSNQDNTITGYGYIGNLSLQNGGQITASGGPYFGGIGGVLTIETSPITGPPDTNTGSMIAASGATLAWQANNPSGTAFINNGAVTVNDGGRLLWETGPNAGSIVAIQNNGNIYVGQGGSGGTLLIQGPGTPVTFDLGGTGTLTLSTSGKDQITGYTGQETLLNDFGHTIQGSGTISNLVFDNSGTVTANTGTLTIATGANPPAPDINSSVMNVSAGATMLWQANNPLAPNFINNGTVNVNDVGTLVLQASPTAGALVGIQNNGSIVIGNGSAGGTLLLQSVNGPVTFDFNGTGGITLSASGSSNQITGATGQEVLLNNAGHTIQGAGTISNVGIENVGSILADAAGTTLAMNPSGGIFNNYGMVSALNGGTASINLGSGTLNNSGAVYLTSPTSSTITITGNVSNSGTVLVNGPNTAFSVSGNFENKAGGTFTFSPAISGFTQTLVGGSYTNDANASLWLGLGAPPAGTYSYMKLNVGTSNSTSLTNSGTAFIGQDVVLSTAGNLINNTGGVLTLGAGVYTGVSGANYLSGVAPGGSIVIYAATPSTNSGQIVAQANTEPNPLYVGVPIAPFLVGDGIQLFGANVNFTNTSTGIIDLQGIGTEFAALPYFPKGSFLNQGILQLGIGSLFGNNFNANFLPISSYSETQRLVTLGNMVGSQEFSWASFSNEATGSITVQGGLFGVGGSLTNGGTVLVNGTDGYFVASGTATNSTGGIVTLGGSGDTLYAASGFSNQGGTTPATVAITGTGETFYVASGGLSNAGIFQVSGYGNVVQVYGGLNNSSGGILTIGGAGNALTADAISNAGFINLNGPTVTGLQTPSSNSLTAGSLQISAGGLLTQTGSSATISGDTSIGGPVGASGAGSLTISGGTFTSFGNFLDSGLVSVSGSGTLDAANLQVFGTGTFLQTGGNASVGTLVIELGGSGSLAFGNLSVTSEAIGKTALGTFNQTGGTHTISGDLQFATSSGDAGTFNLSGGILTIDGNITTGAGGSGTMNVDGGTLVMLGSNNTLTNFVIGNAAGSNASFTLTGSEGLTAGSEIIGNSGTGTFNQNGGSNAVNGDLQFGAAGGAGTYNLSAGTLTVGGNITTGAGGSGTMNVDGGTLSVTGGNIAVTNFNVGNAAGSNGSFALAGGQILTATSEIIGNSGTGTFNQNGGSNAVNGDLQFGAVGGSSGTYNLSGGSLNVAGNITTGTGTSGLSGGTLNIDGGALNVGGTNITLTNFNIGNAAGSSGSFTLGNGQALAAATATIGNYGTGSFSQGTGAVSLINLNVGYNAGSSGVLLLGTGGVLSVNANEYVGIVGTGAINQSGGTNTIGQGLFLGYSGGTGTYSLSGTGLVSANYETIGLSGSGTVNQTGGTNSIAGALNIAQNPGSSGKYNLSGNGSLTAGSMTVGAGGNYNQFGGSATIQGNTTNFGITSILANTFTTLGTFTNSGSLSVVGTLTIGAGTTLNPGAFIQTAGSTLLNGGTIDPATITVNGGSFGGAGTMVGNVSVVGGTLQVGGATGGNLHVQGNFAQSGGSIVFDVIGAGAVASQLLFDPGNSISITNAKITLDFLNGANPNALLPGGSLTLGSFLAMSDGSAFGLGALGPGDTFAYEVGTGPLQGLNLGTSGSFTPTAAVPEPSETLLLLAGLAGAGTIARRVRRRNVSLGLTA